MELFPTWGRLLLFCPKIETGVGFRPSVADGTGRNYTIPDEKHNRFYVPLFTCIYVLFWDVFPFLFFISLSRGKCYIILYFFPRVTNQLVIE